MPDFKPRLYIIVLKNTEARLMNLFSCMAYRLEDVLEKAMIESKEKHPVGHWVVQLQSIVDVDQMKEDFEKQQNREPIKIEVNEEELKKNMLMSNIVAERNEELFNEEITKGTFTQAEIDYIHARLVE